MLKSGCQWGYVASRLSQEINGVLLFSNLDKKPEGKEEQETSLTLLEEVLKNWSAYGVSTMESEARRVFVSSMPRVSKTLVQPEKMAMTQGKGIRYQRHITVDTDGLPHALYVTTANISDKAGAIETIENNRSSLPHVVNILCDGGYVGNLLLTVSKNLLEQLLKSLSAVICTNLK